MRWSIEDRRGSGGIPIAVGGIGGLGAIIVLVIGLFLGIDPSTLLALLSSDQAQPQQTETQTIDARPSQRSQASHDRTRQFVAVVLADTEDVWRQVFESSGKTYVEPKLVLYTSQIASACGLASAASGPFYCPNDQKVYLDLSFFEEMRSRFNAPGEFADAYVVAHEIGHHCAELAWYPQDGEERGGEQRPPWRECNIGAGRVAGGLPGGFLGPPR
jgi:uncharacterized protein